MKKKTLLVTMITRIRGVALGITNDVFLAAVKCLGALVVKCGHQIAVKTTELVSVHDA